MTKIIGWLCGWRPLRMGSPGSANVIKHLGDLSYLKYHRIFVHSLLKVELKSLVSDLDL